MLDKLGKAASYIGMGRLTYSEYSANLSGMRIFFGAVLGFVLAGTEKLTSLQFGVMLTLLASNVILIIYISASKNRVVYAITALVVSAFAPHIVETILKVTDALPTKIMPTLLAWTLMTIAVEFWPRSPKDK